MPPARMRPGGVQHWVFALGGLVFVVKSASKAVPASTAPPHVNGRSQYVIEHRFIEDGPEFAGIARIVLNMGEKRRERAG